MSTSGKENKLTGMILDFRHKKSRVRMPGFSNQQKGCFAVIVFLKQVLAPPTF